MDESQNQKRPQPQSQQNMKTQQGSGQKTNVMAILSLAFAFVFAPLGLVFGIIALVQLEKNPNEKGKGLAIAGLIISILGCVLFMLIMVGSMAFFGVLRPDRFMPVS